MTKRGYIVNKDGNWVIGEKYHAVDDNENVIPYYKNPIPIHASSLPTILDGDNLKPAYQNIEVEYDVVIEEDEEWIPDFGSGGKHENIKLTYAIPKVSEDKGGLDLDNLGKKLDEALAKETPESLTEWMNQKRLSDKGDVWEEAEQKANEYADQHHLYVHDRNDMNDWWNSKMEYFKQHYTLLTKTNP